MTNQVERKLPAREVRNEPPRPAKYNRLMMRSLRWDKTRNGHPPQAHAQCQEVLERHRQGGRQGHRQIHDGDDQQER